MFIRKNNNNNNTKQEFMNKLKNKFELSFSGIKHNNQLKEIDLNKHSSCGIKKISRKSNNISRTNNSRKSPTPKLSILSHLQNTQNTQNPQTNRNNLSVKNNSTRFSKPSQQIEIPIIKKKSCVKMPAIHVHIHQHKNKSCKANGKSGKKSRTSRKAKKSDKVTEKSKKSKK